MGKGWGGQPCWMQVCLFLFCFSRVTRPYVLFKLEASLLFTGSCRCVVANLITAALVSG